MLCRGPITPNENPNSIWPAMATTTNGVPTYTRHPKPIENSATSKNLILVKRAGRRIRMTDPAMAPMPAALDNQPIHSTPTCSTSR